MLVVPLEPSPLMESRALRRFERRSCKGDVRRAAFERLRGNPAPAMASPCGSDNTRTRPARRSIYSCPESRLFKITGPGDRIAQAANVRVIARRAIHLYVARQLVAVGAIVNAVQLGIWLIVGRRVVENCSASGRVTRSKARMRQSCLAIQLG
jgi:hypothetical protein